MNYQESNENQAGQEPVREEQTGGEQAAAGEEAREAAECENAPEPDELELLRGKCAQLEDSRLRLLAEYDNFRKRTQKEKAELYPQAVADTVARFLPLLDNLTRASAYDKTGEDFAKGFDLILQNIAQVLEELGVEELGAQGDGFDPQLHHAVQHSEGGQAQTVVAEVLQKGYKLGDRILRCAIVKTSN